MSDDHSQILPLFQTGPQLENGYTKIANELLEAIVATDFTKREMNILLVIIRKTYGFNKKSDDLTISQISYMTGIGRPNASRTFHRLVSRNVLLSRKSVFGYEVSLNKRYWEWDDRTKSISRRDVLERDGWKCQSCGRATPEKLSGLFVDAAPEVDHVVEVSLGGSESSENLQTLCRKCHQLKTKSYLNGNGNVSKATTERVERDTALGINACRKGHGERVERDTNSVSKGTHTKETNQKTTPKEILSERFHKFWQAYPKKVGKGAARNSFRKINPDDKLMVKIIDAISVQKQSRQWIEGFVPNPATWLNQERWDDEIEKPRDRYHSATVPRDNNELEAWAKHKGLRGPNRGETWDEYRGFLNKSTRKVVL